MSEQTIEEKIEEFREWAKNERMWKLLKSDLKELVDLVLDSHELL